MSTHTPIWRPVREVRLHAELIPQPNNESKRVKRLTNVHVAIEGSFLHIDPRSTRSAQLPDTEHTVYLVPAAAVEIIEYQAAESNAPAPWIAYQ